MISSTEMLYVHCKLCENDPVDIATTKRMNYHCFETVFFSWCLFYV